MKHSSVCLISFGLTWTLAYASVIPLDDAVDIQWTFGNATGEDSLPIERPLNIAHRGASGMYPEHTVQAFEEAIFQGADVVECDIVITKDLELVCSHEPWINAVSNVNESTSGPPHEDFSDRVRNYVMDDDDPDFNWNDHGNINDFFTYDFTLLELQSLRRRQVRSYRDPTYNWDHSFITFEEYLEICRENNVGIYPEIKLGATTNRFLKDNGHNVTVEELVLEALNKGGYSRATDPCFVQSFELSTIRKLSQLKTNLRLIFLLSANRTSDEDLAIYKELGVFGIGLDKDLLVIKDEQNHIAELNTDLIERVHNQGMDVHVFTFRNEYNHLNWDYGQDPYVEFETYFEMGIDGFFTDFPGSLAQFFQFKELELEVAKNSGLLRLHLNKYFFLVALIISLGGAYQS